MVRGLKIYEWLNRIPLTRSFHGKVVAAVAISVLAPAAVLQICLIFFSPFEPAQITLAGRLVSLAAVLGALLSCWSLSKVLTPLTETARALQRFVSEGLPPELPGNYQDEVGRLMANINYLASNVRDLQESEKVNGALDHLTGAFNRRSAENRMRDSIALAQVRHAQMSFAILDIDNFKTLNDTYGHEFGDKVLRQLGDLLRGNIRRTDWVGRWGGDEFVISIEGGEREASAMLSRLVELIRHQRVVAPDGSEHQITLSCGVCEWQESWDASGLFTRADEALYSAKRAGRNQVQVWSEIPAV
jgi:diguanylate cyclase (GGDEF)-like protein